MLIIDPVPGHTLVIFASKNSPARELAYPLCSSLGDLCMRGDMGPELPTSSSLYAGFRPVPLFMVPIS